MSVQRANDYIDRDGFRANVGIVLMRESGELFLGGRVGGRGWQFPQGGVNRGEPVEEALFRELKEEIGLGREDVEVLGSTRGWLRYRLPRQYVRDRCIGQKQRWFLLKLAADESTIALRQHRPAGIRSLALGRLLDAGARSRVFQAARVRARAARPRQADCFRMACRPIRIGGRCSRCARRKAGAAAPARSERLDDRQNDDADQQQRGHLVEDAIPPGRCGRCGRAQNRA